MQTMTNVTRTFPSARIDSGTGALAVEVSLIAQLMHGSGNHLFASVSARQKQHQEFVDELDEPSTKLGGTDFDKGDPTSLYSFVVGPKGHPFHRHAGHRVLTAVSGSGGAQLRFSSACMAQIEEDPHNFIRALQFINIPPDCMLTVRFGDETWHQFAPLRALTTSTCCSVPASASSCWAMAVWNLRSEHGCTARTCSAVFIWRQSTACTGPTSCRSCSAARWSMRWRSGRRPFGHWCLRHRPVSTDRRTWPDVSRGRPTCLPSGPACQSRHGSSGAHSARLRSAWSRTRGSRNP